jgi:hypothetical protein
MPVFLSLIPVTGSNHAMAKTEPSKLGTTLRNRALTTWAAAILVKMQDGREKGAQQVWRRTPLARLLAINLAIGVALAVLLVGGLLVLNPGGLRDLILADRSPLVPIGLLLGGFIVTLGSTAMGTAIMAMAAWDEDRPGGGLRVVKQETNERSAMRR